ncbi:hypothetical protein OWM54_03170 [Myxococcus sp. MISCRS1]|jgi:hypothetical protein|uniref:hypothetical protein n=1 Tax=Myxococcus TaxID=32 RepID=UPI000624812B|nr:MULTISPECIES: hypothetical protein [Myxococcus]AKF81126.1 hypothetical protein MFUL124B02_18220 [Myxococcus fulvus 124B02]BDT33887.1 hypothetical protein MFMH1_35560 [Myxococcus sp. MH1]MBZ4400073.1 hypothetical protein [Myxococcus sp. AS-1-15]MBZ4412368.1 hypothetical protein [Myxococcus sp. XM-1-1-1]MCK8496685.1 hypothetical protein [Myxococcus fulvus]
MASLILRLLVNPQTGRKDVVIQYESDSDALPMEHEDEHRRLVDQLIAGGALKASELGQVIVQRDTPSGQAANPESTSDGNAEKVSQKA